MRVTRHSRRQLQLQNVVFVAALLVMAGLLAWLSTRYSLEADWTRSGRNTLSLDTDKGRVFEVTPQGEIVWEYVNPRGGFYRTQRIAYEDCPQADPYYMETDGHLGIRPAHAPLPEGMGLPFGQGPDYCPPS